MATWKVIALVSGAIEAVSGPAAQHRGDHEWIVWEGQAADKADPRVATWSGCVFAKETYVRKIQPLLAGVKVRVLSSALGISQPYAAEICAGRYLPHPRHWEALQNW